MAEDPRLDLPIEERVSYFDEDTGLFFYFDPNGESHYYESEDECIGTAIIDWGRSE